MSGRENSVQPKRSFRILLPKILKEGKLGKVGRFVRDLAFVGITLFYLKVAVMEMAFVKGDVEDHTLSSVA